MLPCKFDDLAQHGSLAGRVGQGYALSALFFPNFSYYCRSLRQ